MSKVVVAVQLLLMVFVTSCDADPIRVRAPETQLWGYVDSSFDWVVDPGFAWATEFNDGVAIVSSDYRNYFIINEEGQTVGSFPARYPRDHAEGKIPTFTDGVWSYRDYSGEVLLTGFDEAHSFSEGIAFVRDEDGSRYIDHNGGTVLEVDFVEGLPFQGGYTRVRIDTGDWHNERWGIIDRQGEVIVAPVFARIGDLDQGLIPAAAGYHDGSNIPAMFGYIDVTGKYVIPPSFDVAYSFDEGEARIQVEVALGIDVGRHSQMIDETGATVFAFPEHWGIISEFVNGYAVVSVRKDDDYFYSGVVTTQGELVVEPSFREDPTQRDRYSKGYFQLLDLETKESILFDTSTGEVHDFP